MIAMLLNHMVIALWEIMPLWLSFPLYAIGGLTFPILAYFVVQGYQHTSNLKRYILRLLIFGLIAMPFGLLVMHGSSMFPSGFEGEGLGFIGLNIMFSIALGLIVLVLYDRIKRRAIFGVVYLILVVPVSFMFFEWHFFGITMILLFYIIRNEKSKIIVPPIFAAVCWIISSFIGFAVLSQTDVNGIQGHIAYADGLAVSATFFIGCILAVPLLMNYNGERGKRAKWLFYIFYPLHFAVLTAIALALGLFDLSMIGL